MKKLVIIDGKSVFYRGYYAMLGLTTEDGTPTSGVYGFASLAFEVIRKLKPDYVVVAWDKKGTSTARRTAIFADYKAGRKRPPEDFYAQIPLLNEFLEAIHWPLFECDGYEADDILGTLAGQAEKLGLETNLITSDLDMLQLVDENTKVFAMKRGFSQIEEFSLESFEQKYGLKQAQFLDLKALQGDSSDNIPGVAGIGPKTATALLQEFLTLDEIYQNLDKIKPSWRAKLEAGKNSAYMSKELAKIRCDAPVDLDLAAADIHNFDYQKVLAILQKFEFNSMIRKIPPEMKNGAELKDDGQIGLFDELQNTSTVPELQSVKFADFCQNLGENPVIFELDNKFKKVYLSDFRATTSLNLGDFRALKPDFFTNRETIFFDAKAVFHQLAGLDLVADFGKIYDLKQAEFLLNALIRDKSLKGILKTATKQNVDEAVATARISAMSEIYKSQIPRLDALPKVKKVALELDFPLTKVLFDMEQTGVKINPSFFAQESLELVTAISELESEIFTLAGQEFNIASPLQLSKILFEELNLPTKGIKKSRTGFSTSQKELDKLRELHPIIEKIEKIRELTKIKSTYIDALPKLADENDRIHSTFNQDITTTGRLSSSNPNLQNIPIRSELGRKIRAGFVAEAGNLLISADYSQFELRLAAVLAEDAPLIETFNQNLDIHTKTASDVYGVPFEEVSDDQRRAAKIINFSVLYGAGAHNLSGQIGVNFAEAKAYIDEYFAAHQPIRDYMDSILKQAKDEGFVETYFGRRRPTPDINSSNFMIRQMAARAAQNMPVQGTEADLMKRAMLKIDEKITKAGLGKQILQIHDSIMVEAKAENAEKIAEILRFEMENIAPELPIKLQVDVHIGQTWREI